MTKEYGKRLRLTPDEEALINQYRAGSLSSLDEEIRAESYRERWLVERAKSRTMRRQLMQMEQREIERREIVGEMGKRSGAIRIRETKGRPGKDKGAFVAALGDVHAGELVDPATVQGVNEYNPTVASARLNRFFNNVIKTYKKEAIEGIDLNTFVLALMGDFITGYIHEHLMLTNTMSPMEETIFCFEHLRDGIQMILDKLDFESLEIPTSLGNHARTTKRMFTSGADKTNYETIIYEMLRSHFKDNSRVRFIIEPSYATLLDVCGMRIRFHHGEKVKGNGGVGGITIPLNKWIDKYNKETSVRADYDVLAHHHTLLRGRNFMVNGSVIGTSHYGISLGYANEPARQGAFVVREGCPFVICENTIFLGH
jgi:hypothetical protein